MDSPPLESLTTGCPDTKEIIYPAWRDTNSHYVFLDQLIGAVAFWAVRQSPYDCPDNLEGALKKLTVVLREKHTWGDAFGQPEFEVQQALGTLSTFTCKEIRRLLEGNFTAVPEIMAWNEKKVEGYNHEQDVYNPDFDFIDLGALALNVANTLILESLYNKD